MAMFPARAAVVRCVSGAGETNAYVSWPGVLDDGRLGGTASTWRSSWCGASGPAVERRAPQWTVVAVQDTTVFGRPRGRPAAV